MIGKISQKDVFGRLSRDGIAVRQRGLWVSCLVDPALSGPHVAYAIGRRAGNAVARNRLRRRLRRLMAQHESSLRPAWYLIGVSSPERVASWAQLSEAVTGILESLNARLDHTMTGVAK